MQQETGFRPASLWPCQTRASLTSSIMLTAVGDRGLPLAPIEDQGQWVEVKLKLLTDHKTGEAGSFPHKRRSGRMLR